MRNNTERKNKMITITLQKIRDKSPCAGGWRNVLAAHEHLGMDAEFPLTSVLNSNDLEDTIWCFECLPEYSWLWRKYAVWCARQVEHLMTDERSINALNVAWRHSDGNATDDELAAARAAASAAAWDAASAAARAAASAAARAAASAAARAAASAAAWDAARAAASAAAWDAASAAAWDAASAAAWDATWDAASAAAWDATWDATWDAASAAAWAKQQKKLIEILNAGEWVDDGELNQQLRGEKA